MLFDDELLSMRCKNLESAISAGVSLGADDDVAVSGEFDFRESNSIEAFPKIFVAKENEI